jgi:hypothetical protein
VGTSGFRAYLSRKSRYVLIPNVIAITGTKESEANNMIGTKKFNGRLFSWAWSYTKKKKAEAWAGVMRKAGIKVRIVRDIEIIHLWVCISDAAKLDTHAWKILKGKAYAAAERA